MPRTKARSIRHIVKVEVVSERVLSVFTLDVPNEHMMQSLYRSDPALAAKVVAMNSVVPQNFRNRHHAPSDSGGPDTPGNSGNPVNPGLPDSPIVPTSEPHTLALMSAGSVVALFAARRRKANREFMFFLFDL